MIDAEVGSRLNNLFGEDSEKREKYEDQKTEAEVGNRIDALFGEGDEGDVSDNTAPPPQEEKQRETKPAESAPDKKPKSPAVKKNLEVDNSILKNLKSAVLSLEWEITDQVMQTLTDEIEVLEEKCKNDKVTVAFLQLLGSLSQYIRKKKADAHPESLNLLNSVYENLETVILSEGLTDVIKKKLLVGEVSKYKKLKENILVKAQAPKKAERKAARKEENVSRYRPAETHEAIMPPFSLAGHEEEAVEDDAVEVTVVSDDDTAPAARAVTSPVIDETAVTEGMKTVTNSELMTALQSMERMLKEELNALREELQSMREKG
jgi:hypothetical protein